MVCETLLQPHHRGFKPILRFCTGSVVRHQPCMHGEGWAAKAYLPHEALCIATFTPWLINDALQVALHPVAQQHLSVLLIDKDCLLSPWLDKHIRQQTSEGHAGGCAWAAAHLVIRCPDLKASGSTVAQQASYCLNPVSPGPEPGKPMPMFRWQPQRL